MPLWEFALWGLAGAGCVEALEFAAAILRTRDWPWRHKRSPGAGPLAVSVVLRLGVGVVLAMALGSSGQLSGPLGTFVAGLAAPVIIERFLKQVSLPGEDSTAAQPALPPWQLEGPEVGGRGDVDAC